MNNEIWSNSPIYTALAGSTKQPVNNFGSIEGVLKSILGPDFDKKPEPIEELEKTQKNEIFESKNEIFDSKLKSLDEKLSEKLNENLNVGERLYESEDIQHGENRYRVFRDRDENFECKVSIQGAGLTSAQVRLTFDSDMWNIVFYGKLYKDGNCVIPLKKACH